MALSRRSSTGLQSALQFLLMRPVALDPGREVFFSSQVNIAELVVVLYQQQTLLNLLRSIARMRPSIACRSEVGSDSTVYHNGGMDGFFRPIAGIAGVSRGGAVGGRHRSIQ